MDVPLLKEEHPDRLGWRLMGDVTTSLNRVALALHEAGLAGAWRNEQLAVPEVHPGGLSVRAGLQGWSVSVMGRRRLGARAPAESRIG